MTPIRKDSLGVIYIHTRYDDPKDFELRQKELDAAVKQDYVILKIDGDQFPDLTVCLNKGIHQAIQLGCEYVHWCHGDFHYDDPDWYDVLRHSLEAWPQILKICASNSRDEIHPMRIGQEQSWLMATSTFTKFPWAYFDERYLRCGGCEDYQQHFSILGHGFIVAITPETTIFHKGAQTRGKYDTNEHQLRNQGIFAQLTGFGGLVEIHKPEYFGCLLDPAEQRAATENLGLLGDLLKINEAAHFLIPDRQKVLRDIFPAQQAMQLRPGF